jgi:signal transduction histidine kinase
MVVENARLYHRLQAASHRKDEFLAMLGHELRNPLAPIRNAMQILRLNCAASPELHEVAEMVERQILQLTRLVDDLLDVSRVGHGKINLQMKPVDLKTVVALAIESSRPLIDARKHILKVSLPRQAVDVDGGQGRLACRGGKVAYDGQTALALARLQSPEVVICDISMPGMSGLELARYLRQDVGQEGSLLVALSG